MNQLRKIFGEGARINSNAGKTRPDPELERTKRKIERERSARKEAERILEGKSRELFELNVQLMGLNEGLESLVRERTAALKKSIARIEQQHQNAEYMARHDPLTELPNRRFITDFLNEKLENWQGASLLYIDLDRFKQINDAFGHPAGDALLKEVANRLKEYAPKGSITARIGGDEFVILVPPKCGNDVAIELAEKIVTMLPEPVHFEGSILRFGASVGIANNHPNHNTHEDLMIEADLALYGAKEAGRGRAILFTKEMRETCQNRKQLSDNLIVALEGDQIRPVYQPRICTETGNIVCLEALARWYHPEHGTLDPDNFLSIAEDIGRLAEIDEIILQYALQDIKKWDKMGLHIPRVSVNVSGRRLMQPDLFERLDRLQIPVERISFELVESVFFDSADQAILDRLDGIRSRGIRIEIDDFGSGHASINGLLVVRPSALKIDRHLVAAALDSTELVDLLKAVISIGNALGIEVVAEGVETISQIEMCSVMGCHQLQGYGISLPVPALEIFDFYMRDSYFSCLDPT